MNNYSHPIVSQMDTAKFGGSGIKLALIPATHDADAMNITVIFNTHSGAVFGDDAPFLDQNKQPVSGIHVRNSMHKIHVANCSLKGLVVLSKDDRVSSINLAKSEPII